MTDDQPAPPPAPDEPPPAPPPAEPPDPSPEKSRFGGLPTWAIGGAAAAIAAVIIAVVVVVSRGGDDGSRRDPVAPTTSAVTNSAAVTTSSAPATTTAPTRTEQLQPLPSDEEFAATVVGPVETLTESTDEITGALSNGGSFEAVFNTARSQATVVTGARAQLTALPTPARADQAAAMSALLTATGEHRRYLDQLARATGGAPTRARLRALDTADATASRAVRAYEEFFRLTPAVNDGITGSGLGDTAGLRGAMEEYIAEQEAQNQSPPPQPDPEPGAVTAFQSPTGNIRCQYSATELFCSTANDNFAVMLPPSGPPITASGTAPGGVTLPYGSVWSLGAFSCQSLTNGFTCENSSGNGFFLSRETYNSW